MRIRRLAAAIAAAATTAALLSAAPAAADVPLTCPFGDDRSRVDRLPRPGVVVRGQFDSYETYTIAEDGSLDFIFIDSAPYGTPLVSVWQNGTTCTGQDFARNAWAVAPNGRVYTDNPFGQPIAGHYGDASTLPLQRPVVGMSPTSTGLGYWLVAGDGGIFTYGDARFLGSTGNIRLNRPIVGMSTTPSGRGYWMVASDGGIFTYGDARFFGSTGAIRLNRPITGMTATPSGNGYWLVADDGGIFTFGDAVFRGSTGGQRLSAPIAGMVPNGNGYTLIGQDGQLYPFR